MKPNFAETVNTILFDRKPITENRQYNLYHKIGKGKDAGIWNDTLMIIFAFIGQSTVDFETSTQGPAVYPMLTLWMDPANANAFVYSEFYNSQICNCVIGLYDEAYASSRKELFHQRDASGVPHFIRSSSNLPRAVRSMLCGIGGDPFKESSL